MGSVRLVSARVMLLRVTQVPVEGSWAMPAQMTARVVQAAAREILTQASSAPTIAQPGGVGVSGCETVAGAAFEVSRGAMKRGKTRNPTTSAATAIAPIVTGSSHGLFAACVTSVGIAVALGVGASKLELSLAFALALIARSAACCAAYACTFRRTQSPGRPGSSADKRR